MTTKKETKQEHDMLALPLMMTQGIVDYTKKTQEITMDYFKALEQNQHQTFKKVYGQFNQLIPGESKIWDQQRQMIEKSFQMMDQFTQVWK